MPDKAVLDSSLITAIFFKEDASQRALEAITECDTITLDLAIAEVGNVAWKLVVLSGNNKDRTLKALQKCLIFISETCDIIRSQDHAEEAYEIAVEEKVTFYDSLFMAAALRKGVPLLTLDRKLYEAAKGKMDVRII